MNVFLFSGLLALCLGLCSFSVMFFGSLGLRLVDKLRKPRPGYPVR